MARGKGGLGRGLDSLFEDAAPVFESGAKVDTLPLREIEPDPEQPRKTFDEQALGELAARCGTRGMVAGQCADLTAEETGGNAELLRYIHLHKTADLLTAPLAMGLTLAGAGEDLIAQAREYGKNLGIAFQIIDDILDVTGDEATLGKHTGKDALEHKCTWVSLYGLDQARKDAKTYTERAADSIKNDENAAIFLKTLAQRALVRVQ